MRSSASENIGTDGPATSDIRQSQPEPSSISRKWNAENISSNHTSQNLRSFPAGREEGSVDSIDLRTRRYLEATGIGPYLFGSPEQLPCNLLLFVSRDRPFVQRVRDSRNPERAHLPVHYRKVRAIPIRAPVVFPSIASAGVPLARAPVGVAYIGGRQSEERERRLMQNPSVECKVVRATLFP